MTKPLQMFLHAEWIETQPITDITGSIIAAYRENYKLKKLLYIACAELIGAGSDGVSKKVIAQTNQFAQHFDAYLMGYSASDIMLCHNGNQEKLVSNGEKHRRYKLLEEAVKQATVNSFSYVYIRHMYSDRGFVHAAKELKNTGCKIIIEIPTYPYKDEAKTILKLRLMYFVDCIYRHCLKKYVARIATFSKDDEIFSIPCINIMNGIDVDSIALKRSTESAALNLLAIASMGRWHGYDRLIEGLHDYYSGGGTDAVVLHLVGDGSEMPRYRQLVHQYSLQDNVVFHGFKSGAELDELFNLCDVAIECLAAHRKGLHLSSSLKSREYGAQGMPMVTSCEIDAFPSKTCDYILKTPEDESNIDINQIIRFYHSLTEKYGNEEHLAQQIRSDTRARCDMSVVMKPIVDCFLSD